MRIHYLQHVPFEDSANIGLWAQENGYPLTMTRIFEGEPFPEPVDIDLLAVMGGPMNVYQYRDYPWLKDEKIFIERAIAKNVKVIGICFGAQLIADVLGSRVVQNSYKEIGWHEVILTDAAEKSRFFNKFPRTFTAFHWHGDTFEIPFGAIHLASSQACSSQAFQYGENVLALQFHLEYSQDSIEKMLKNCAEELIAAPYVQQQDQIRQGYQNIEKNKKLLKKFLGLL